MKDLRVPIVWVVSSHRELGNEYGKPQMYTVMDEASTRTLLNMGPAARHLSGRRAGADSAQFDLVDGVLLGGSPRTCTRAFMEKRKRPTCGAMTRTAMPLRSR